MTPGIVFVADPHLVARTVVDPTGCWLYDGYLSPTGYGKLNRKRLPGGQQNWVAHRYAYTLAVGPIPEGLTVDHLCRVRRCINPEHLRVMTLQENLVAPGSQTTVAKFTAVCPKGHEKTPENTVIVTRGGGRYPTRKCRTCVRAIARERGRQKYRRLRAERGVRLSFPGMTPAEVFAADARFVKGVTSDPSGCWPWHRTSNRGWGVVNRLVGDRRKSLPAYRWAWILAGGPTPEGLVVDALCGNRNCVNPEHMLGVMPLAS